MRFPTKKVCTITRIKYPPERDYIQWKDGTLKQLQELIDIKAADLNENQNDSPSIGEFMENLISYGDKISLKGYIIFPPRDDARVSVDGFKCVGLTVEEALAMVYQYRNGDDVRYEKAEDGTYTVDCWWD